MEQASAAALSNILYNATVRVVAENERARVIRAVPTGPKTRYLGGQYGCLGLASDRDGARLVKRPYSLSSSLVNDDGTPIDHNENDYYEFYFNRVQPQTDRESLTAKLFLLKDGDGIFCGGKIVGYFTAKHVPTGRNALLIASTTGEAATNALAAQWLLDGRGGNICNVTVGPVGWETLYRGRHDRLMRTRPDYRYDLREGSCAALERHLERCCRDEGYSRESLGFVLRPQDCQVFLCGDPDMIGAPQKKGAWAYERPSGGALKVLEAAAFSINTKFKQGNVEYETYW